MTIKMLWESTIILLLLWLFCRRFFQEDKFVFAPEDVDDHESVYEGHPESYEVLESFCSDSQTRRKNLTFGDDPKPEHEETYDNLDLCLVMKKL